MARKTLKQVLMDRDGLAEMEAEDQIQEAFNAMHDYLAEDDLKSAENVCTEYFGLEPDYLDDLINL